MISFLVAITDESIVMYIHRYLLLDLAATYRLQPTSYITKPTTYNLRGVLKKFAA